MRRPTSAIILVLTTTAAAAGCDGGDSMSAADLRLGEAVTVTLDDGERFVAASPSGERFLTQVDSDEVCVRSGKDYADSQCIQLDRDVRIGPLSSAWSDDETQVVVAEDYRQTFEGALWLIDSGASIAELLLESAEDDSDIAYSPVSMPDDRIAYLDIASSSQRLRAIDPDTKDVETLHDFDEGIPADRLVADGESLLISSSAGERSGIWRYDVDNDTVELVMGADDESGPPYVIDAAAGNGVVTWPMLRARDFETRVSLLDIDSGDTRLISAGDDSLTPYIAGFSPDGSVVAIASYDPYNRIEMSVRDVDGDDDEPYVLADDGGIELGIVPSLELVWTDAGIVLPGDDDDTVHVYPIES